MLRERVKKRKEQKQKALWDEVSEGEEISGQEDEEDVKKDQVADGFDAEISDDSDVLAEVPVDRQMQIDEAKTATQISSNPKKLRKIKGDGHFNGAN